MKDLNRAIAFWLLSKYCGSELCSLEKVNLGNVQKIGIKNEIRLFNE